MLTRDKPSLSRLQPYFCVVLDAVMGSELYVLLWDAV